jgi:hypothetical protein
MEEGVLEWRNLAPPSSRRPFFRFTLRSVLELRLAYQRGTARPGQATKSIKSRRRPAPSANFQPKHLRRKQRDQQDGGEAAEN